MFNYLRNKLCLVDSIKQLELEVHNQQQLIQVLQEQLEISNEKLTDKNNELTTLDIYTKQLESKLNTIKQLVD